MPRKPPSVNEMKKNEKFQEIVRIFRKVEGTSIKQAELFAYALLTMKDEERIDFGNTIVKLDEYIHLCKKCNMWHEEESCPICDDKTRDIQKVLIVNDYRLVNNFEKTGKYRGLYFVIHDAVSVNTTPETRQEDLLRLADIVRINKVNEVILGFDPTQFGDVNALYVEESLRKTNVKITRLGRGVPTGGLLTSLDLSSLEESLANRTKERKN